MKKKSVHVIAEYKNREIFQPDCDVSRMLVEFKSRINNIHSLVPADVGILEKYGWEIHYKGFENATLDRLGAIYDK